MGHIHEKIDFTTSIYIVHDKKVLLHMHKKLHVWLPPGGHIELDEDPNEAALREAKEETGLEVSLVGEGNAYDSKAKARDLIPPRFLNRHYFDETRTHEHVDLCYLARPISDVEKAHPEEAGGEIRWFSEREIDDPSYDIVSDVRNHAKTAIRELSA